MVPAKMRYKILWSLAFLLHSSSPTLFTSRSGSQCHSQGGTCEPMINCLLNGLVAGQCSGMFAVCCHRPTPANRWIEKSRIEQAGSTGSQAVGRKLYSSDWGPVLNDAQCGRPDAFIATRRVLDGQPAGFANFPWTALIGIGKGKCGGVLVSHRHIVTAGHCVKNKPLNTVTVTLGEYHIKSHSEPLPARRFRVIRAVVHPRFQFSPAADRYDVAVLTLDRPVRYAPHIAPICLPEAGRDPAPGTNAYVVGWGALIPDDVSGPLLPLLVPEIKRPSILQVVNVPVLENARCEQWHRNKGIKVRIWPEMVCAGYRNGGKDSCKGDSGGPLMVQQRDGRWVLIGLVSAGFSCGKPGQPGIYHRISSTSDWVSFHVNGGGTHGRRYWRPPVINRGTVLRPKRAGYY